MATLFEQQEMDRRRLEGFRRGSIGTELGQNAQGGRNEYQTYRETFELFNRYAGQAEQGIGRLIQDFQQNPFVQSAARMAGGLRGDVLGQIAQFRADSAASLGGIRSDLLSGVTAQSAGAGASAVNIARLMGGQSGMGGAIGRRGAAEAAIGQTGALAGAMGQLGGLSLQSQQFGAQAGIQGLLQAGQVGGGILTALSGQENALRGILAGSLGELGTNAFMASFRPKQSGNLLTKLGGGGGIGSIMGGIGALGGGIATFSDERLKTEITEIGTLPSGAHLYSWRWKGTDQYATGVMAQEMMDHVPEAVLMGPDGFFRVDYSKVW